MITTQPLDNLIRKAGLTGLCLFIALSFACSKSEESRIKELAPDLPDDAVHHLIASDDSTLAQYARDIGLEALEDVFFRLGNGYAFDSIDSYQRSVSILLPLQKRLARIMASEYQYDRHSEDFRQNELPEPEHAIAVLRLRSEKRALLNNPNLRPEDKIEQYAEISKTFEDLGERRYVIQCKSDVATLYSDLGNSEEQVKYLCSAIFDCHELAYHLMACQMLGELGSVFAGMDQVDSMRVCYEKALRMADRHHLWKQYARITTFYAAHYKRMGRLALARGLYQEAQEVCRRNNLGDSELRFVWDEINFHADLGAWHIVGRLLHRVRILQPKSIHVQNEFQAKTLLLSNQMEARYLMALGEVDSADAIYKKIRYQAKDLPWRLYYPQLLYYWAKGLVDNEQPGRAMPIIRDGLRACEDKFLPELNARLLLLHARAYDQLGDIEAAAQMLAQFDELTADYSDDLWRENIDRDVLQARIFMKGGDRQTALTALEESLKRFTQVAENLDASVYGYLSVAKNDELRQLLHDLVADDPALGYGAEFFWRDVYRVLGAASRNDTGAKDDASGIVRRSSSRTGLADEKLTDRLRKYARVAELRIMEQNAVHCAYLIRDGEVWRWTCSRQGIRRDTLAMPASDLAGLVSGTWTMLSSDPGDRNAVPSRELTANLRTLALALLPEEILNKKTSQGDGPFFVSAGGFLGQLPFETLNIATGEDYRPLLQQRDVAYIRHMDAPAARRPVSSGVVLVNARTPKQIRNRYLSGSDLSGVAEEGKTVAALNPGSVFLHDDLATKQNLMSIWEDAS
ncbi:MAG: hypothetical protein ABIA59_09905, partial [Candidatus Latescibacterota bacterium]